MTMPVLEIPDYSRNDIQQMNLLGGLAGLDKIGKLIPFFLAVMELLQQFKGSLPKPATLTDE